MQTKQPRRPGELVFNLAMVLGSLFLLWSAYGISGFEALSAPGAIPMVATATMVICGLLILRDTLGKSAVTAEKIERDIDALNGPIPPLNSFILPGGSPAAAALHLARTICRRAERLMVELASKPGEKVSPAAIEYINRVSDFLFVAARACNDNGANDVLWVPGANR